MYASMFLCVVILSGTPSFNSSYLPTPARVTDGYSQRWRWVDGREEHTTRELSVKCAACCKSISKSFLVSLGQISTLALCVGL